MTAKPMHGDGAAPLLAGIDLGTLTCRLLVARVGDGGGLQPVHVERRILRLGEGVQKQGRGHVAGAGPALSERLRLRLRLRKDGLIRFPVSASA